VLLIVEGKGETKCREVFEDIFGVEFPKAERGYLEWLINDRGHSMHLDGYNEDLNLAFEYQGLQHWVKRTRDETDEHFNNRVRDDKTKVKLCKKYGVMLIVVDYTIKFEDMKDYIVKKYEEMSGNKLKLPRERRKLALEKGRIVRETGKKKRGTKKCTLKRRMIRSVLMKLLVVAFPR